MKKEKNTTEPDIENLKEIAPSLFQIRNRLHAEGEGSPFKVPVDYFLALEKEVMEHISSLPDLESVDETNPFQVPEGYFNSLPALVQQRIVDKGTGSLKLREWISGLLLRPKYALAFASVALLVVTGLIYLTRTITLNLNAGELAGTEQWETEYLYELDETILADALADESVPDKMQDESIEDYLLENDIDITSITDRL